MVIILFVCAFAALVAAQPEKNLTPDPFDHGGINIGLEHLDAKGVHLKNADQEAILKGVKLVSCDGTAGFLSAYELKSFPILSGTYIGSVPFFLPVGVAGRNGNSRMVGFSHDQFMNPDGIRAQPSDKNAFILNVFRWAGGASLKKVALVLGGDNRALVSLLEGAGVAVKVIWYWNLASATGLDEYDVICIASYVPLDSVTLLKNYLSKGKGLIVAVTSWAHGGGVVGDFATNYPANMLSKDFGFVWWKHHYAYKNGPGETFNASLSNLVDISIPEALAKLKATFTGTSPIDGDIKKVVAVLETAAANLPMAHFQTLPEYQDLLALANVKDQPTPTVDKPVTSALDKFKLQTFHAIISLLPPTEVKPHPSSSFFPGLPQSNRFQNASRKHTVSITLNKPSWFANSRERSVPIDRYFTNDENRCTGEGPITEGSEVRQQPRYSPPPMVNDVQHQNAWYSTGLYATAGQIVELRINSPNIPDTSFLWLQIGIHSDDIARHDRWSRPPKLYLQTPVINGSAVLNSPYGGPVIIWSSKGITSGDQPISFSFTGAVKAPYFVLGKTTPAEWKTIRNYPGPWAELQGKKLIVSVPSSFVKDMDDPTALLSYWDKVQDNLADLVNIPRDRYRPERFVPDVQISVGDLHSGYPIMYYMSSIDYTVNLTILQKEGSWGHFHELGHNLQQGAWTFGGTGEVTNNVMVVFLYDKVLGIPSREIRDDLTLNVIRTKINEFVNDKKRDWSYWKNDPWFALLTYIQLQKAYGWEAFTKVFAEYQRLTDAELPKNDQAKMDMWAITFSKVVKKNLHDFFKSWGMPMSEGVSNQLSEYPPSGLSILQMLDE